jgi:spore coat polysaccharide biosynthesis protein SpsF
MLQYLLEGLAQCRELDDVCVATSVEASDDPVAAWCADYGTPCLRGSLEDVAGRFVQVCRERELDAFVRICGDSPLLDWRLVDRAVNMSAVSGSDLVSNTVDRSYPKGQSVEVVSARLYERLYAEMADPRDLEHMTRYLHRCLDRLSMVLFKSGRDWSDIQLSVDTREDMDRFEALVSLMDRPHWEYGVGDLVELLKYFEEK